MARSTSHSAPPASPYDTVEAWASRTAGKPIPRGAYATGFRSADKDRYMYCLARIAAALEREERREPGAVADKRRGSSVGERCAANSQLEVLRPSRVPNLRRWHGLVSVDDS